MAARPAVMIAGQERLSQLMTSVTGALNEHHNKHGDDVETILDILGVLGFIVGNIMSQAPSNKARELGNEAFSRAFAEGCLGTPDGATRH